MTREVVHQFDTVLSTKANRMDVLELDDKFRIHVKSADYEKFKVWAEDEIDNCMNKAKEVLEGMENMTGNLKGEIASQVKRQTQ